VNTFRLVSNDVTSRLLEDWEEVRKRIAQGETRAFALVQVNKDMSMATMWAVPEPSNLTDNVLTAGAAVLHARLVEDTIRYSE
jgi:hypothetical protein